MIQQLISIVAPCAAAVAGAAFVAVSSKRRHPTLKRSFVDEGIALAERHARNTKGLTSRDKHHIAVEWAREQCAHHKVKTTDSELSKLVEIRLGAKSAT